MKKYILLLISALCLLSACQEELIGVSSVSVDKERQDLSVGASFVLKAIISPSNADNQKIIWTVENSSVIDYVDNQDVAPPSRAFRSELPRSPQGRMTEVLCPRAM